MTTVMTSLLGLLRRTVTVDGEPLATIEPLPGCPAPAGPAPVDLGARYRLSRFAVCRRDGETLVLESPRSRARVLLLNPRVLHLASELAAARTPAELGDRCPGLSPAAITAVLESLAGLHLVGIVDETGAIPDESEPPLESWEFHDLLFHAGSRIGRHNDAAGATYRFRHLVPPLPARKPPMSDSPIPLERADLLQRSREDESFIAIAERRRSIRTYGERPVTVNQLGEFLYRSGRVRGLTEAGPDDGRRYEMTSRPYPNGGAVYELELYVIAKQCDGLEPGLYHYDPFAHALEHLSGLTSEVEMLVRDASQAAQLPGPSQVLISIASRFQRRSWKYAGIAYANTLKNVGVLYQTMYLVATAMGLAPCALGVGDADLLAAAAGLDPDAEASVGEFLLGSAPGELA